MPPGEMAVTGICLKADGSDRAEQLTASFPTLLFSVGIHPWDVSPVPDADEERAWERLEALALLPNVAAIGECGIDLMRGNAPLFRQMQVMKRHVELSERAGKPLLIHDVKAHDILVGMRRDMKPSQPWAIHGFRLKAGVAEMMLRAGFMLSLGPDFNPDSLRTIPRDRLLAETDDSPVEIGTVIARLSAAAGEDLGPTIAANSAAFLGKQYRTKHPVTVL